MLDSRHLGQAMPRRTPARPYVPIVHGVIFHEAARRSRYRSAVTLGRDGVSFSSDKTKLIMIQACRWPWRGVAGAAGARTAWYSSLATCLPVLFPFPAQAPFQSMPLSAILLPSMPADPQAMICCPTAAAGIRSSTWSCKVMPALPPCRAYRAAWCS